ncbi:putative endonuclease protein [Sulfuricella denitrificans skB26]|uniref:phospholipase D n=1 Tax=Sulfuricella denitrificans (strain DSM 22764 / NBRC 105220 / skB26) TaxID=1163617 RepID=S6B6R0_SULDS|nr:phospholipase D family protein [Sulfuricella denitrificans]BAN36187.1 putative endonuclease protein [Sulfuricella denitrificans skB26]
MKKSSLRILPLLSLALLFTTSAPAFEQAQDIRSHAAAVSGTVQVLFTPEDDATGQIVQAIEHAQRQVLVQTFSFTSREISEALISAKQRGVDVRVVTDADQIRRMERSKVPTVAAGGVPVFVDSLHDSAHNKVMVIDAGSANPVVITGSFNFTHAAQFKNAENLLIFRGNRELTAAYLENWLRHREHSQPLVK